MRCGIVACQEGTALFSCICPMYGGYCPIFLCIPTQEEYCPTFLCMSNTERESPQSSYVCPTQEGNHSILCTLNIGRESSYLMYAQHGKGISLFLCVQNIEKESSYLLYDQYRKGIILLSCVRPTLEENYDSWLSGMCFDNSKDLRSCCKTIPDSDKNSQDTL